MSTNKPALDLIFLSKWWSNGDQDAHIGVGLDPMRLINITDQDITGHGGQSCIIFPQKLTAAFKNLNTYLTVRRMTVHRKDLPRLQVEVQDSEIR